MHMSVLVPKRMATSTLGASVSVTSQTGITVCSSTWLVHMTPVKVVTAIQARLRIAGMPSGFTRGSLLRTSWLASGSRRIAALLARNSTALSAGSPAERVGAEGDGPGAEEGADAEADVEGGVHVGPGLDPLRRREDVDDIGAVGRPAQRARDLHGHREGDVLGEAVDERPRQEQRPLDDGAEGPHALGAEVVDQLAHGYRDHEARDRSDGEADPDLRPGTGRRRG